MAPAKDDAYDGAYADYDEEYDEVDDTIDLTDDEAPIDDEGNCKIISVLLFIDSFRFYWSYQGKGYAVTRYRCTGNGNFLFRVCRIIVNFNLDQCNC